MTFALQIAPSVTSDSARRTGNTKSETFGLGPALARGNCWTVTLKRRLRSGELLQHGGTGRRATWVPLVSHLTRCFGWSYSLTTPLQNGGLE
jgi:hypothetical protein